MRVEWMRWLPRYYRGSGGHLAWVSMEERGGGQGVARGAHALTNIARKVVTCTCTCTGTGTCTCTCTCTCREQLKAVMVRVDEEMEEEEAEVQNLDPNSPVRPHIGPTVRGRSGRF